MPSRPAEHYRGEQAALMALLVRELRRLWRLLNPRELAATFPAYLAAVEPLVAEYGAASATLAADFYDETRAAARVRSRFTARPADPAPAEQIEASLRWAVKDLWYPTEREQVAVDAGQQVDERVREQAAQSVADKTAAAQHKAEASMERLALLPARNTTELNVQSDDAALGWAREVRSGACWFCVMLATRGAVYLSKETATVASGRRGSQAAGEPYHDHCRCVPVPSFTEYEPTADIQHWQQVWDEVTANTSGKASLDAFKEAFAAERARQAG